MRTTAAATAAALALLAVAACGQPSGTTSTASPPASSPASCRQQYETWKHGPARAAGKQLVAALKLVQSAGSAQDFPRLNSALGAAGKTAATLRAMPAMPRCADPAGYYGQMLDRITAAGDNARSSGGLGGLLLAMVPLRTIPKIENELSAELARTTGTSH